MEDEYFDVYGEPPFYDDIKMYEREEEMRYVSTERFEKFISNEFYHLRVKVNATLWISLTILAVLIGTLVIRFLFG